MMSGPSYTELRSGGKMTNSKDSKDVKTKLDLSFLVRIALSHAPVQIQTTFQSAVTTFAHVIVRQKQLSNTRFVCDTHIDSGSRSEDILDQVCTTLNIERQQIDPDRVIWLNQRTLSKFLIRPGQWVNLCKYNLDGENNHEKKTTRKRVNSSGEDHFTCQILPLSNSYSFEGQEILTTIILNPVAEYNLRKSLNILPFVSIPYLQLKPLVTDPVVKTTCKIVSFMPIQAKSVKLRKLKSCSEVNESDCDILIRDMFLQNDKYHCIGDIISCQFQNNASLDFVVSEINDKQSEQGCRELFRISSAFTKIVVDSQELSNQFHVALPHHKVKKLLAPCLEQFFFKMEKWITQALIFNTLYENSSESVWPNFLVYGPVGSGKTTVCQTIAGFYGFNFHFINGVNLIGDTSAYTEGKFRAVLDQVRNSTCPALVYIKNVHLVGKDKEGNEDKRIIFAFKEFLQEMVSLSIGSTDRNNPMTSRAVFVVGSTNFPDLLVSGVAQNFLFKLEFPHFLSSVTETEKTVRWLLSKGKVDVKEGTDIGLWVKTNCEGMRRSYGDLKAFVAGVLRYAFLRNTEFGKPQSDKNKLSVNINDLDLGLKAIDTILKQATSTVEVPKVNWEDIGGLEDIKKELVNSVRLPLEYPHLFASGIRRSGILLYGPPGTGKTLIAKAVATEFKLSFISVKGPELLNMYVGQSEQNVRNVFEKARSTAPCIIFFDELDALAPNRGRAGDSGGVMDRVVSQILAEMDGTHSTPNVFIIGATNRPDLIDPALLRPGRFDKLLYVGISQDINSKTSVLKALTRKFQFSKDVDLTKIASMLPSGMSGADLYSLCSDTYMTAVERHIHNLSEDEQHEDTSGSPNYRILICMKDFETAISRATTTLSEEDQAKYEALKMMTR